jgi:predicted RNA-binding protein with RPS1 domain
MGHVSLCFDVDNGILMCETANIIKEITQVISVDNNKKISTCLRFFNVTENSQHEYCLHKSEFENVTTFKYFRETLTYKSNLNSGNAY